MGIAQAVMGGGVGRGVRRWMLFEVGRAPHTMRLNVPRRRLMRVASGGGNGLIPRSNASCTRSIIIAPVRRSTDASGYRARKSVTTGVTNRTMPCWQ